MGVVSCTIQSLELQCTHLMGLIYWNFLEFTTVLHCLFAVDFGGYILVWVLWFDVHATRVGHPPTPTTVMVAPYHQTIHPFSIMSRKLKSSLSKSGIRGRTPEVVTLTPRERTKIEQIVLSSHMWIPHLCTAALTP